MHPPEIEASIEEAYQAWRAGDHLRTLAITDQLAELIPDDPLVRCLRAYALLEGDSPREALDEARVAVEMVPANHYGQLALARSAWRMQRNTLAQQAYERAVACSHGEAEIQAEFAWFMANERGPKLAEEAAREAIQADDQSSTAWASVGIALHRLHREHEAEESLSRALELDPNNVQAQSGMLVLLQFRGETRRAAALAEVMQDASGAEEFVESARRRARMREADRLLYERAEVQQAVFQPPRDRRWLWLLVTLVLIGGLWLLVWPTTPFWMAACVAAPVLVMARLYAAFAVL